MDDKAKEILREKLIRNLSNAFDEVIDGLAEILDDNLSENEQSDTGEQKTQLTVQPKIKITYAAPDKFAIKARIDIKDVRTISGESEEEFSASGEQPELPMNE